MGEPGVCDWCWFEWNDKEEQNSVNSMTQRRKAGVAHRTDATDIVGGTRDEAPLRQPEGQRKGDADS